jgi:NAD(P)-dependent dehydrogenase (short-subunit alcohol dehydrogenase family)
MSSIDNKSAVITGASSGIGRACVSRMIQSGWRVFATVRNSEDGDRLRSEFGSPLTPVIMDVTDRASIVAAAQQVAAQLDARGLSRSSMKLETVFC